jgi:hypothetical protein
VSADESVFETGHVEGRDVTQVEGRPVARVAGREASGIPDRSYSRERAEFRRASRSDSR